MLHGASTCLALLLAASASLSADVQAIYFVSPSGDDANSGLSAADAFRTIAKARDMIRPLTITMTGDLVVRLLDGTHRLDETLVIGPQDSGNNGHRVIYQAAPGTQPIVSGGVDLSGGWTLHDETMGIYRRTGVSWLFRQLYVNDSRATRARSPNRNGHANGGPYYKALNTSHPFSINKSEIGPWSLNGDCEFVWLAHWNQRRGRVLGYTTGSTSASVTLKAPESGFNINSNSQNPTYYYLESAYELLDAEGEWFLDTAAATLYYKPRGGEDMATATVIAPKVERLFDFTGTAENPVHDIAICGVSLRHDNWTAPSSYGYVDGQGGQAIKTGLYAGAYELFSPAPAMVFLTHVFNIRVERCTFSQGGSWGVGEALGSHHNAYVGNHFTDLASGAIVLGNIATTGFWWDFPPGSSSGTVAANNLIDNVSCDYRDNVGIMALKCRDLMIEHNEVRNLPYSGISIGFEWQATGNQQSANNRVRYNRVHKVMNLLDDGGGIYTLGAMPETFFSGNFIYSLAASPYSAGSPNGYGNSGIYLDNGSTYKTADSNVVDRCGSSFLAYDGSQNTANGNFYNCPLNTVTKFTTWTNNADCRNAPWPAAALAIMHRAGVEVPYHDIGTVSCGANIAPAGTASASSVLTADFSASKGNDNNGNAGLWSSDGSDPNPWWQVDMGTGHRIFEVEIVARQDSTDQPAARGNFAILASNAADFSTHTVLDSVGGYEAFLHKGIYAKSVADPAFYRFVRIQRIQGAGVFNFAECRIFGLPVPAMPADLLATAVSASRIDLSWSACPSDVTGIRILRSLMPDSGFTEIASLPHAATTHSDTGIGPNTLYYYQVLATSPAGVSLPSIGSAATLGELAAWRLEHFQTTAGEGAAADIHDFDNDGMANLMEYALGGNPTLPDAVFPTASIVNEGGQSFLTLCVTRTSIRPDVIYQVEVSDDLATWSTAVSVIENSASLLKARDDTPSGSSSRRFIRLRVSTP